MEDGVNIFKQQNQKPKVLTCIPGEKSQSLFQQEKNFLASGLQNFALMSGLVLDSGEGSLLRDVDGNEFLDLIGGIGVNGLGHSHPEYVKAVTAQLTMLSVGSFSTKARIDFLALFDTVKLKDLNRVQFYSSGSEAVESALRLSKNKTQKTEFVSFSGGFHGKTLGALSLMGSSFKDSYGPFSPGTHTIPYANCYRCPVSLKYPSCGLACVEIGRKQLKESSRNEIAAFIIEPAQGTSGNVIPPIDFLRSVESLAKEFDALLIVDEMITGFGRTGKFWGSEHSNLKPDILTMGKQLGGGVPISALATTDELSKVTPWGHPSGSSSSFGGNPLACAAAKAATDIIINGNLVQNSKEMGHYFLNEIKGFVDEYSFVGEVHGIGLLLGIELVSNKFEKTRLTDKALKWLFQKFLSKGLLTMSYNSSFRIQPAMTIDKATIDNALKIIREVFDLAEHVKIRDF